LFGPARVLSSVPSTSTSGPAWTFAANGRVASSRAGSVDKQRRNNQHGAGNNQLSGGRAPEPGLSFLRQRR
jgi:hypothetical protein